MSIITSRTHRRWLWAVAVVLAAVIVAVAALTRGNSSPQAASQTQASVPALARAPQDPGHTQPTTHAHHPARASSHSGHQTLHRPRDNHGRSVAQAAPAPTTPQVAAGTAAVPAIPQGGRTIRTFAGSGNGRIGSLSQRTTTVLEWRAPGQGIQIFTSRGAVLVDSTNGTGSVRLPRGEYAGLRVASRGSWVIRLRAQL